MACSSHGQVSVLMLKTQKEGLPARSEKVSLESTVLVRAVKNRDGRGAGMGCKRLAWPFLTEVGEVAKKNVLIGPHRLAA